MLIRRTGRTSESVSIMELTTLDLDKIARFNGALTRDQVLACFEEGKSVHTGFNIYTPMKVEETFTSGFVTVDVNLLKRARAELKQLVDDEVCDHSVGICWCSTFSLIYELGVLLGLEKKEDLPDVDNASNTDLTTP